MGRSQEQSGFRGFRGLRSVRRGADADPIPAFDVVPGIPRPAARDHRAHAQESVDCTPAEVGSHLAQEPIQPQTVVLGARDVLLRMRVHGSDLYVPMILTKVPGSTPAPTAP